MVSAAWIEVVSPGLLTTVQDLGRPGHAHEGIAAAGAADPVSARAANRLVGNPDAAALLELTAQAGTFIFGREAIVAIAGASCEGMPAPGVRTVPGGTSLRLGRLLDGARAYLAVRGGLEVAPFLGSASTHLLSGLGGFEGRPLRRGDRIPIGPEPPTRWGAIAGAADAGSIVRRRRFRVTPGAQRDRFSTEAIDAFFRSEFRLTSEADRSGLRLDGPVLAVLPGPPMPTEGVLPGAVQVPEGGRPIVLLVEHGTTGGYPKIADVIAADLPAIGQLRPGDAIRFVETGWDEARAALADDLRRLDAAIPPPSRRAG